MVAATEARMARKHKAGRFLLQLAVRRFFCKLWALWLEAGAAESLGWRARWAWSCCRCGLHRVEPQWDIAEPDESIAIMLADGCDDRWSGSLAENELANFASSNWRTK